MLILSGVPGYIYIYKVRSIIMDCTGLTNSLVLGSQTKKLISGLVIPATQLSFPNIVFSIVTSTSDNLLLGLF